MAYNEYLQERIESILNEKKIVYRAMKMMGGLCFMVDEKMCLGVVKDDLMARVGPESEELLRTKKGARPMDFTKRPMKGYLFIDPDGIDYEADLTFWIDQCLKFNPEAKASKKKKPKKVKD
ncbi:MAG: TfoX/Sxy family transcriptional regulator of competence genes [Flavobacteriaceae bacterium]|jgi:TfoX/Sxy family transcriptional regulator of competence genes